ncbi:uncharacterized protein LOC62_01G000291 [Vanrija pseudolonga]|uniref:Uncharacterized protein n=1 Tax=Vanrija pseudolonga TaxID=143232 RepID=A0AAF0Y313_9TREE|nr:hypothetical protein LOC62_01G000291 [Vanrija pseudolonga]
MDWYPTPPDLTPDPDPKTPGAAAVAAAYSRMPSLPALPTPPARPDDDGESALRPRSRRSSSHSSSPYPLLTPDLDVTQHMSFSLAADNSDRGDDESTSPADEVKVPASQPIAIAAAAGRARQQPVPLSPAAAVVKRSTAPAALVLGQQDVTFDTYVPPLTSTPTTELGQFEYPVTSSAATSPTAPTAAATVSRSPPASAPHHHKAFASVVSARAVSTSTAFHPRPPPLGRRGSIASGQISRLAAGLPGPDRPEQQSREAVLRRPQPVATGSTPALPTLSLSPSLRPVSVPATSATALLQQPASPRFSGQVYLPPAPAQPRRGGPIAFAHAPLPAPIPPSLLARRGSVPHNSLLGLLPPPGGWATSPHYTGSSAAVAQSRRRLSGRDEFRPKVTPPSLVLPASVGPNVAVVADDEDDGAQLPTPTAVSTASVVSDDTAAAPPH